MLTPDTELISYDAEALFPSIPINDCLTTLKEVMSNDAEFKKMTKLIDDVVDLLYLCLSSTDFTFDERHHTQNVSDFQSW